MSHGSAELVMLIEAVHSPPHSFSLSLFLSLSFHVSLSCYHTVSSLSVSFFSFSSLFSTLSFLLIMLSLLLLMMPSPLSVTFSVFLSLYLSLSLSLSLSLWVYIFTVVSLQRRLHHCELQSISLKVDRRHIFLVNGFSSPLFFTSCHHPGNKC